MADAEEYKLPEADLPVSKLVQALAPRYLSASYKIYWFWGLLDIIKEFPSEKSINIEFDDIIKRMIALCWYTILEYRLNFGAADNLEQAVLYIEMNTELVKASSKADILSVLDSTDDRIILKYLKDFMNLVPYRFLTTFIPSLTGIPDYKRNALIVEASRNIADVPYTIVEKTCVIDSGWLEYFYINNAILTGWAQLRLVSFLQARNPNVPAIPEKLEAPHQRNLAAARKYWSKYLTANPSKDIFISTPLESSLISIDHFIPWSFVLHDRIWNLIPTSREVNSRKGNKLPPWEKFFTPFADLQYKAYHWHKGQKSSFKTLEDFLLIKPDGIDSNISKNSFSIILENTLQPAYRIAANQGFGMWEV